MPTFAMRITSDLIDMASQFAGSDATEVFDGTPYVTISVVSPNEFNLKLMSEDEMLSAYKNDSTLHILS